LELADDVFGTQVQVDFDGGEAVVAQEALERGEGDAFLDCGDGE